MRTSPQSNIDQNQFQNQFQTVLLILAMVAILGLTGFLMFGVAGFIGAIGVLCFGLFMSGRATAAVVLRMYKASPITRRDSPLLTDMFLEVCARAELNSQPRLYYVPSRMPNAFAVGTGKSASVAVTDGLIRMMTPRELAGILAHEVAHIKHGDIRVMTMADAITRTTSMVSRFGLMALLFTFGSSMIGSSFPGLLLGGLLHFFAPSIMIVLQLAGSRTREFNADLGAAELTGDPYGLASALSKLERPKPSGIVGKILRPGTHRKQPAMLRTHPPTKERVEKLMEIVKLQQQSEPEMQIPSIPRRVQAPSERVRRRPRYHVISGSWH